MFIFVTGSSRGVKRVCNFSLKSERKVIFFDRCTTKASHNKELDILRKGNVCQPKFEIRYVNSPLIEVSTLPLENEESHCDGDGDTECNYIYLVCHRNGNFSDIILCMECYTRTRANKCLNQLAQWCSLESDEEVFVNLLHEHRNGHHHCQLCGRDTVNFFFCPLFDFDDLKESYCIGTYMCPRTPTEYQEL